MSTVGDGRGDGGHLQRAGEHLPLAYGGRTDVEFSLNL